MSGSTVGSSDPVLLISSGDSGQQIEATPMTVRGYGLFGVVDCSSNLKRTAIALLNVELKYRNVVAAKTSL